MLKVLGSENFTRWLMCNGVRAREQCFSITTTCVEKVQINSIVEVKAQVFSPLISVLATQTALPD